MLKIIIIYSGLSSVPMFKNNVIYLFFAYVHINVMKLYIYSVVTLYIQLSMILQVNKYYVSYL